LGVHGQPETSETPERKPRFKVKGHPEFAKRLKELRDSRRNEDKRLASLIYEAIATLEECLTAGDKVPRDRWPRIDLYRGIPNLFRYKLDRRHRLTYSVIKEGREPPFAWIIEEMDHTEYNRRFGYD